jgi:preprotein translocase subunit SecG
MANRKRNLLPMLLYAYMYFWCPLSKLSGGGLAANFSASNQIMGVRKTADFLEKATCTLAGSMIVLCMLAAFILPSSRDSETSKSILDSQIENAAEPGSMPSFPTSPITPSEPDNQTE